MPDFGDPGLDLPPWATQLGDATGMPWANPAPPPTAADAGINAPPVTPPQQEGQATLDGAVPPPPVDSPPPLPAAPPGDVLPGGPPLEAGLGAPPPPMPPPDAVSGVAPQLVPTVADQPDITIRPETHADQYTNAPWQNPDATERDAAARSMAINDPVAFQAYQAHLAEAKVSADAAGQARIAHDDLVSAKADLESYHRATATAQAKSDAILADALKLAATKPDRKRWFRNLNIGQQFAAIGTMLIGGLLQGANGGRNAGTDFVMGQIDKDVDDQKAEIERGGEALKLRQGAVAQEFARTGDLFHATETVRLATRAAAISQLQTEQQDYDPRGTSFANIGRGIQSIAANQAQVHEQVRKTAFDEGLKIEKARQEAEQQAEARRHNRAEESLAWTRESRESKKDKADNTLLTPQQIHEQFPALPIAAIPPDGATVGQLGKRTETYNKTLETADKTRAASGDERSRQLAVGEVVDDKGEPVLFRDPTHAGKLADSKGAVDSGVQLIDRINSARAKYGWSPDLLRSEEWRRMQADYGALVLQKKNTDQLGVLSEGDMELIGKSLGTKDPTEARDPTAGLKAARENMINNVNAQIRGQAVLPKGRSIARWEPPPPPEMHRETPDERADKEVLENPQQHWSSERLFGESGLDAGDLKGLTGIQAEARVRNALPGMAPSQRSTLDAWATDALGDDQAKRDKAIALLTTAVGDDKHPPAAELPAVIAYAQQILDRVGAAASPGLSAEPTGPELGVAHEVVPPMLWPPPTGVR